MGYCSLSPRSLASICLYAFRGVGQAATFGFTRLTLAEEVVTLPGFTHIRS